MLTFATGTCIVLVELGFFYICSWWTFTPTFDRRDRRENQTSFLAWAGALFALIALIVFGILASFWEVCSTLLYCCAATSLYQVFSKVFVGGTRTPLFLDLHSLFGTYEWSEAC